MILRALILAAGMLLGAAAPFSERTKTDFDTFLQLLNPYGHWVKMDQRWLYEPLEPYIPMTEGQWMYTDFGWYWLGKRPFSWATDHYGVWLLGEDNVWRWKPDPSWSAAKVEWRGTPSIIGWRPTTLDRFGEMTEPETKRYARPEEWTFFPRTKLTTPFTSADVTVGDKTTLEQSEIINHTFVTWREIDRFGPDPYDAYGVAKSILTQTVVPPGSNRQIDVGAGDDSSPLIVSAPKLTDRSPVDDKKDDNQKKPPIHTIMSLPSFYFSAKPDPLQPLNLYVYRPEIYQDSDGIQRRIEVWQNPPVAAANREKVNKVLEHGTYVIDVNTPSITNSVPPSATTSTTVSSPSSTPTDSTPATPPTVTASTILRSKP